MQHFLQVILLTALSAFALPSWGQITIERNNFTRLASFQDTAILAGNSTIVIPTDGPAQVWDYSTLTAGNLIETTYSDASGDLNFAGALNVRSENFAFQSFVFSTQVYESIDDDGWWEPGRMVQDTSYSIGAITGSASDTLRFVGGPQVFDGRIDLLKFPLSYQDEWTESYIEDFNFELTVTAFGIIKVPGKRKRILTTNREVTGYGQLTIPNYDGSPGTPMDVLLIKTHRSGHDSIFLAGEPAPAALLAAFGLVQGSTAVDSFYTFYRNDFGATVLNVNMGSTTTAYYRPAGANVMSAVNEHRLISTSSSPNPITAGQTLTLQIETAISSGVFSIRDMTGLKVHSSGFDSDSNQRIQVELPSQLVPGLYVYQLHGINGSLFGSGKLIVN